MSNVSKQMWAIKESLNVTIIIFSTCQVIFCKSTNYNECANYNQKVKYKNNVFQLSIFMWMNSWKFCVLQLWI